MTITMIDDDSGSVPNDGRHDDGTAVSITLESREREMIWGKEAETCFFLRVCTFSSLSLSFRFNIIGDVTSQSRFLNLLIPAY